MGKAENKQVNKKQETQSVSENKGLSKIKYEIRNISGQDLTVCGVRINPYEKLQIELKGIPKNLKRLEEKGLIVISEVN
jgi:hypothetical protein